MAQSQLTLTIAGTKKGILMIEGGAHFLSEEQMMEAIALGHAAIQEICTAIELLASVAGKAKKRDTLRKLPKQLLREIDSLFGDQICAALSTKDKSKRGIAVSGVEKLIEQRFVKDVDPQKGVQKSLSSAVTKGDVAFAEDDVSVTPDDILEDPLSAEKDKLDDSKAITGTTATSASTASSSPSSSSPVTNSVRDEDEASEVHLGLWHRARRPSPQHSAGITLNHQYILNIFNIYIY